MSIRWIHSSSKPYQFLQQLAKSNAPVTLKTQDSRQTTWSSRNRGLARLTLSIKSHPGGCANRFPDWLVSTNILSNLPVIYRYRVGSNRRAKNEAFLRTYSTHVHFLFRFCFPWIPGLAFEYIWVRIHRRRNRNRQLECQQTMPIWVLFDRNFVCRDWCIYSSRGIAYSFSVLDWS